MDQSPRSPRRAVPRDGSKGRRVLMGLMVSLTAPLAWAGDSALASSSSMSERVQLNGTVASSNLRVTQSIGEPLATAGPLAPQDALRADRRQSARQTMLWAENARTGLGVGVGVEQRQPYGSAAMGMQDNRQPQMEGGMLVGASLATSPRSHLVVQTSLMNPSTPRTLMADDPQFQQDQQRQVRMGLVFNTKKPLADLRQGFRMELSGQTTLAVKPRGGKLGFAFQKVW